MMASVLVLNGQSRSAANFEGNILTVRREVDFVDEVDVAVIGAWEVEIWKKTWTLTTGWYFLTWFICYDVY